MLYSALCSVLFAILVVSVLSASLCPSVSCCKCAHVCVCIYVCICVQQIFWHEKLLEHQKASSLMQTFVNEPANQQTHIAPLELWPYTKAATRALNVKQKQKMCFHLTSSLSTTRHRSDASSEETEQEEVITCGFKHGLGGYTDFTWKVKVDNQMSIGFIVNLVSFHPGNRDFHIKVGKQVWGRVMM